MQNPFRSEAEAYRFLLLGVGYFAAIVIAKAIGGTWAGFAVFVVLPVAAAAWYLKQGRPERPVQTAPRRRSAEDEKRILVIANETVGGGPLREEIRRRSE